MPAAAAIVAAFASSGYRTSPTQVGFAVTATSAVASAVLGLCQLHPQSTPEFISAFRYHPLEWYLFAGVVPLTPFFAV